MPCHAMHDGTKHIRLDVDIPQQLQPSTNEIVPFLFSRWSLKHQACHRSSDRHDTTFGCYNYNELRSVWCVRSYSLKQQACVWHRSSIKPSPTTIRPPLVDTFDLLPPFTLVRSVRHLSSNNKTYHNNNDHHHFVAPSGNGSKDQEAVSTTVIVTITIVVLFNEFGVLYLQEYTMKRSSHHQQQLQ